MKSSEQTINILAKVEVTDEQFRLHLKLPKKWVFATIIVFIIKLLPEWWQAFEFALQLFSNR